MMKSGSRTTTVGLVGGAGVIAVIAIYAVAGGFRAPDSEAHHHAGAGSGTAAHDHKPATAAAADARVRIDTAPAPGPAPEGMVWVPGGTYWMGCDDCGMSDTAPVHLVTVDGFWMDRTPVTNAQFAAFVKATGYVTVAEKAPDPKDFPGAPREALVAGSAVFVAPASVSSLDNPMQWWRYVPGADWRRPEGKGSTIEGREHHPVVHVAWDDAVEYLKWAKKELPTEAQYEFAARGGLDRKRYAWGDELRPAGRTPANIWQGRFPVADTREDGYGGTSPVSAFAPNGFGLYDMGGNVWQWCADWYRPDAYARATTGAGGATGTAASNPRGPSDSYDPDEPSIPKRVQRGGSFLCSDQYCSRYLVGSRGKGAADSGGSNVGFRGVRLVASGS
jgi:formylglycine-generating enzyme